MATPIADQLASGVISTGIVEAVRKLEIDAASSAKALATINKRRAWDRQRKANSTGKQKPCISLATDSDSTIKKERKRPAMKELTGDLFGSISSVPDDWPEDYVQQFWDAWPRHRRKYEFKRVSERLAKIRKARDVTWARLFGQECAYFASNPETKFIPAPLVWLNGQRWLAHYEPEKPAKMTLGDIMRGGIARHG